MSIGRHWIVREVGCASGALAILLLVLLAPFHHALAAQKAVTGHGQGLIALCGGGTVDWPDDPSRPLPDCPLCHLTKQLALPPPSAQPTFLRTRPPLIVRQVAEHADRPADHPTRRQRARGPPILT